MSEQSTADLHLHTYYSDGTEAPAEVVARAAKHNLNIIAITDHDTIEGVPEALEAGKELGVQVIPAVEITTQIHQQELHMLAYFPPDGKEGEGWQDETLLGELDRYAQYREKRAEQIVKRLNTLGIPVTMEEVRQQASLKGKSGTLGRPHVASAMVAGNHVSSMDEAFRGYLKKGRPAWVEKERVPAGEIIEVVQKAGGVTVLAHPGLLRDEKIPQKLLKEGMSGVEAYHSRHTSAQSRRFHDWAMENGLLVTGGSDCHGMRKGEPLMGRVQFSGHDLERFLERLGG